MSHLLICNAKRNVKLQAAGKHPLRLLHACQKDRSWAPRIYAEVEMTAHEMAALLPHRTGIAIRGAVVSFWGEVRTVGSPWSGPPIRQASWTGIADWNASPLRAWLAPIVAEAAAETIDRTELRELLHATGFLDREAATLDVMRFLAGARRA